MRHTNTLLFLVSLLTITACAKAGKEVAEELGLVPSTCGSEGARIEATIGGDTFCANAQIIALSDGASANISGVGLLGTTLTLQVDSLAEGTFSINEAENALLLMSLGTPYVSVADQVGTLHITGFDPVARRLKADLEATVRNEMDGATKNISASIDVIYTLSE